MMVERPNALGFWIALLSYQGAVSCPELQRRKLQHQVLQQKLDKNIQICRVV